MREAGEIQIADSPMLVPKSKNSDDYCNQFTDQDGNPLNVISVRDDGTYCGSYFNFYKDKYLMIPYKILKNGKAEYWASPEFRIIGPQPKINKFFKATYSIK